MTTAINVRKGLHRKSFEMCNYYRGGATLAGFFCTGDKYRLIPNSWGLMYAINGVSAIWEYIFDQDSWMQLPNSGVAGTFGAGSCGEMIPLGMLGGASVNTATAGTTNSLTTNRTIVRNLKDCKVRVVAGTGVGYEGLVKSNTIGANSIITLATANGVAFDATTQFQIFSGSLWFLNAGTPGFSVYDRATNSWTAKSVTGLPAWGTGGMLLSTQSLVSGVIESGTSSGTNTSTTLNDTAKAWTASMWINSQIRITAGTGKGQVRKVSANTTNGLTVSAAWTVTPDATSVYAIEGDDDALYLAGNNAVTMYKYSISGNTWATLAPGVARAGAKAAGGMSEWVTNVPEWTDYSLMATGIYRQNGRYIYSFRAGGGNVLDVYDIAANTWINGMAYGGQMETFTSGSCCEWYRGNLYINKEATGQIFQFNANLNQMIAYAYNAYVESTTRESDRLWICEYQDGSVKLPFIFHFRNNRDELHRLMMVGEQQ